MCSSSARTPNYNLLLNNHRQESWILPKKIMNIQGERRSPSKMVGGSKFHLDSNPIPARDAGRAQTKPCVHKVLEPTETEPDLYLSLLQRYESAVACRRVRDSGGSYLATQAVA